MSWQPTHRLLAQEVRLLARSDDRVLVEFSDHSIGWIEPWPTSAVMVPIAVIEEKALHL